MKINKCCIDVSVRRYSLRPGVVARSLEYKLPGTELEIGNVTNVFSLIDDMKLKLGNHRKLRITVEIL